MERTDQALHAQSELSLLEELRREFENERAAAVLQQVHLRRRGADKFDDARQMLFTPTGLAQATSDVIARYKASRFGTRPVWDLCCGIGGDLRALARRGTTLGIDVDPLTVFVAQFNVRRIAGGSTKLICDDVMATDLPGSALLHIDPDRRSDGHRSVDVDHFRPSWDQIERLMDRAEGSAVKLAPASRVPDLWCQKGHREWIGHRGECKQQILWTAALADAGRLRTATVLSHAGGETAQISSKLPGRQPIADGPLGRYLYEPHASVLCGELVSELADQLDARRFSRDVAYLTGDRLERTLLAAAFEIIEALPLRATAIEGALGSLGLGIKEVKTRGLTGVDLSAFKKIHPAGPPELTIVLTRVDTRPRALLCRRCE
jgi:hypothetical protein